MSMLTFIIDAFTDAPFRGNPAGVCIAHSPLSDEAMLNVARELNLSETAFIRQTGTPGTFAIRYFSPKMEIPLCGHATLASARAVASEYGLDQVHFTTIRGVDLAVQTSGNRVSMIFPVYETAPAEAPPALLAALGIEAIRGAFYNEETRILLLEIADPAVLADLRPDFEALLRSHSTIHGVLVTAASGSDGYDYHSRFFWPWSGSNEDPVTGGTQTFLAKYWAERLGKTRMKSFQSSTRSGFMDVEVGEGRVLIRSEAVIVLRGRLLV